MTPADGCRTADPPENAGGHKESSRTADDPDMTHAPHGPLDLLAYDTNDRVLRARIDLRDDRLSDVLTRGEPIPASDVIVRDLRSHAVAYSDVRAIDPRVLGIVVATGPRGSLRRRVETVSRPVSVFVGRYVVHGFVHAPAPADPLDQVNVRAWIAVTEAILEHHAAGRAWRERFDALLVNRAAASAIVTINEATHETHWLAGGPPIAWPELLGV
jgi:hypothetical protein